METSGTVIKGKMPQHAELLQEVAGSGIPYDVTFKISKRFWESKEENEEEGEREEEINSGEFCSERLSEHGRH